MTHKPNNTPRRDDLGLPYGVCLDIAVMGIANDNAPDDCCRSIGLVNRVMQSGHHFAGLTSVRDEDVAIRDQIRRLSECHMADVVLIIDEARHSRHDPTADAPCIVPPLDGMMLFDPRLGFIGVVKLGTPLNATAKPH